MNKFYDSDTWSSMSDEERDHVRFTRLLNTLFYLCDLAGFHIEGRIVLKDKYTGKVWR